MTIETKRLLLRPWKDEDVRDLLGDVRADLLAELVGRIVDRGADVESLEFLKDFFGVGLVAFADRQDHDLFRREPGREGALEVFEQDAREAFDRSEARSHSTKSFSSYSKFLCLSL